MVVYKPPRMNIILPTILIYRPIKPVKITMILSIQFALYTVFYIIYHKYHIIYQFSFISINLLYDKYYYTY